ncbi:hypothetical protein DRJ17_02870 [Candidatus Woesearchaeota archaeon]|nr:MAG: hypothetical protein DRJ17_02870 [Candidatus Woesearchaeota archaeon]
MKYKKAQQFSFDLLTAFIVFGVVITITLVVIFGRGTGGTREKVQSLDTESSGLADRFVATEATEVEDPYTFIVNNQIDQKKLSALIEKDYELVKRELGLRNDFVIYFRESNGSLSELKAGTRVFCYGGPGVTVSAEDGGAVPCCSKVIKNINDIPLERRDELNAGCEKLATT